MCTVECHGKGKDSGEYNLFFSSTLIKTQVFTALHRDTGIPEKVHFLPCFQNQACSKLNTSLILAPNVQKLYNHIQSHIYTFSLGKRVHYQCYQNPLPLKYVLDPLQITFFWLSKKNLTAKNNNN